MAERCYWPTKDYYLVINMTEFPLGSIDRLADVAKTMWTLTRGRRQCVMVLDGQRASNNVKKLPFGESLVARFSSFDVLFVGVLTVTSMLIWQQKKCYLSNVNLTMYLRNKCSLFNFVFSINIGDGMC